MKIDSRRAELIKSLKDDADLFELLNLFEEFVGEEIEKKPNITRALRLQDLQHAIYRVRKYLKIEGGGQ